MPVTHFPRSVSVYTYITPTHTDANAHAPRMQKTHNHTHTHTIYSYTHTHTTPHLHTRCTLTTTPTHPVCIHTDIHVLHPSHFHLCIRLGRYDGITVYQGIYKYRRYDFQYGMIFNTVKNTDAFLSVIASHNETERCKLID